MNIDIKLNNSNNTILGMPLAIGYTVIIAVSIAIAFGVYKILG